MKRTFLLLWTALLLLGGCAAQQETVPTAAPAVTVPAAPTEPAGIYDASSFQETASSNALRIYPLEQADAREIAAMGQDLLVLSSKDGTKLTRYSGETLCINAETTLPCSISFQDAAVRISHTGVSYYDERRNELVVLNMQLQESTRIPLPDSIRGRPALSADRKALYYCTRDALRCMDLDTGLDRLVKELYFDDLTLTALHCGDTVISCAAQDRAGHCSQLYISTQTGQLLYETPNTTVVWTYGTTYFATHADGFYTELLTGDSEQGPTLLSPYTYNSHVHPVLNRGGTVLATDSPDSNCITLDYYHLQSGVRTAALPLPGREIPHNFISDGEVVCFLRPNKSIGGETLCRWDIEKSATGETVSHFSARHTSEFPDEAGLTACRKIAHTLSEKYGVEILLWTDAAAFQPQDYTLIPEYQVPVIQQALIGLDSVLALYPDGLLQKAAEGTTGGRIKICLVRSIEAKADADCGPDAAAGLQFWQDTQDGHDGYLALSAAQDTLMQAACHRIFHILESRVMTQCTAYDEWDKLNPADFEYTYDDTVYPDSGDFRWLQRDDRAFIDTYSMSYPKEDRARIMEYAMMPGNEALFQTETMQKKLRLLSLGIREAFGMEKTADAFLWEQYLHEPLHHG